MTFGRVILFMPIRLPSRNDYRKLVQAFEQHGQNWHAVAKTVGASRGWVRRGWERGWTDKLAWAIPFKDTIGAMHMEAKALEQLDKTREKVADATVELARQYDVDVARIEARALSRTVEIWDTYIENFQTVAVAAGRVATSLAQDLQSGLEHLEVSDKIKVLADVAKVAQTMTSSLHEAMKARRLHDDKPTEIVRHEVAATMTDDEVRELLLLASDAAKYLSVLPGTEDAVAWQVG
jgi:hypothetical protein